jgi:hypothetical protein
MQRSQSNHRRLWPVPATMGIASTERSAEVEEQVGGKS